MIKDLLLSQNAVKTVDYALKDVSSVVLYGHVITYGV